MGSIYAAFILDCILGDPYWFPHPVRWIGRIISIIETLVRRVTSSSRGLKIGGIVLTITVSLFTYFLSFGILLIAKQAHIWLYHSLNVLMLWTCLAAKCLSQEALKVHDALKKKDLVLGRKLLSYIVGRDTGRLGEDEITRAVVETVGENTSDGIIAPLFYMFVGGAPLALAYKAINTMDSMIGYKNEKYQHLGWASAKLDDIVNYVPARISAFFIALAAFILKLDYKNSFQMIKRDGRNHSSPNSGYPEAAVAGALGIKLGGSNYYFGKLIHKPIIGDSLRQIAIEDIRSTIRLMYGCLLIALFVFSIIKGVFV